MASRRADPRRERLLLAAGFAAAFAISAVSDLRALGAAAAVLALAFRRGLLATLRRVARSALPVALALSAASWGLGLALSRRAPPLAPYAALVLRAGLIALLTFAVLDRVNLLRVLSPWPAATRLLVITLGQIHALRLVATDSLQGLRSRLVRKPRARDVLRGAGGITAALLTLSARNARDVSDAMRARGFP